jgi:hypothetical protein
LRKILMAVVGVVVVLLVVIACASLANGAVP